MNIKSKIIIMMLISILIMFLSEYNVLASAERVREDHGKTIMKEDEIDKIDDYGVLWDRVVVYLQHVNVAKGEINAFENGNYTLTDEELSFEKRVATKYKNKMETIRFKNKENKETMAEYLPTQYNLIVEYRNDIEEAELERDRGQQEQHQTSSQMSATEAKEKAIELMGEDYLKDSQWFRENYTAEQLASKKAEAEKYKNIMYNAGTYDMNTYNNLGSYIDRIEGAETQNQKIEENNGKSTKFGSSGVTMQMNSGTPIADPTTSVDTYKPSDLTASEAGGLIAKAGVILGMIRNIGIAIGVIGLSIIGIRYMFASIEEKAAYKETMMPYMLGCVLLMAGTTVINLIYSVAVMLGK